MIPFYPILGFFHPFDQYGILSSSAPYTGQIEWVDSSGVLWVDASGNQWIDGF